MFCVNANVLGVVCCVNLKAALFRRPSFKEDRCRVCLAVAAWTVVVNISVACPDRWQKSIVAEVNALINHYVGLRVGD